MNDKDNEKKSHKTNNCDFLPLIITSKVREKLDKEEINRRILAITPNINDRTTVVKFFTENKFPKNNTYLRNLYIVNTGDVIAESIQDNISFYEQERKRILEAETEIENQRKILQSWTEERVNYVTSEKGSEE